MLGGIFHELIVQVLVLEDLGDDFIFIAVITQTVCGAGGFQFVNEFLCADKDGVVHALGGGKVFAVFVVNGLGDIFLLSHAESGRSVGCQRAPDGTCKRSLKVGFVFDDIGVIIQ